MDRPPPNQLYEPLPRAGHVTVEVGGQVYVCSGSAGPGRYHSPSLIEVFDPETGLWHQQPTTGEIPPAVSGCAYATIGSKIYLFGGFDDSSHHNTLHELDLSTMVWREVRPRNPSSDGPQRKSHGRMVAYGDHSLVVCGGHIGGSLTDELHVFNLKEGTWSSPRVSGTPPPPCHSFSLTKTDEHHAVMFGGAVSGRGMVNDVYLLDMQNWHWMKLTTSGPSSPDPRQAHAACCIAGPLLGSLSPQLFVTGGLGRDASVTADAWVLDLQSKTWMKVDVPDGESRRYYHTLTVVSSGPTSVQLVEFGGQREWSGHQIAATVVLQLEVDKDHSQAGGPLVWRVADVATTAEPQRWKQMVELRNLPHHHRDPTYPGVRFYGESHCERVTSESQRVAMEDVGVTVSVPSGAVAAGEEVDLTVRPCLTGRFILPEGYKAASPVYLIRASADFLQDVQVTIEHYSDLQSKEDCTNMAFLFASTTPVPGSTGPEYRFEEVPAERTTFRERQRVGTVAQSHSAFIMVARRSEKGKSVYSMQLYRNVPPSSKHNIAVFCFTPCQPLYMQTLSRVLEKQFPHVRLWPSVIQPVCLSSSVVSLVIPSDVSGWSIVPDRHPPQISQAEVDLHLSNPDYAQSSSTYPPRILLTISPTPVVGQGRPVEEYCHLKVEGIVEELGNPNTFTLSFPVQCAIRKSIDIYGRDEGILNESSLANLLELLRGAAPHWRSVGVYLGFLSSELNIIERKPLLIPEGCPGYFRDMLSQWLRWAPPNHPPSTVLNLASTLRRAGEETIALHLEVFFGKEEERCEKQKALCERESALKEENEILQQLLQETVAEKEAQEKSRQEEVKCLQKQLQESKETVNSEVKTRHREAEVFTEQLQEKNTAVITIRGEVECLQKQLRENKDTTHKLDSEVKAAQAEMNRKLDEKDMEIVAKELAMQEETEGLKKQLQECHTLLQQKDSDIEHLHQNLREKEALMADLEMEMESMKKDREARSEDRQSPAAAPCEKHHQKKVWEFEQQLLEKEGQAEKYKEQLLEKDRQALRKV